MRSGLRCGDALKVLKTLPDDSIDSLITDPPGGIVLDCFAGSGSTLMAAKGAGFKYVGIEQSKEYVAIARKRIKAIG